MRATVAPLLLLVLAAVATGGEARAGDGGSARQLLTNPDPPRCDYPNNCGTVLKHECKWLPEAHPKCDYEGKKYHVPVKNCFKDEVSYVSIDNGHECTEYRHPKPGQYFATLELKCGANITIYGYDERKLKGDGSESCKHKPYKCKTCKYEATYHCEAKYHPGDVCREADGKCDVAEKFDDYCHCPYDRYQNSTYVCRPSKGLCDAAEYCTGDSGDCPEDKYASHDTVCRKKAGPCDVAEYCHHGYCPGDKKVPAGKLCRKKYGKCDVADYCDGYSADCVDKVASNTTVCREAKGPCDAEEKCDGYSKKCPKDYCIDYRKELKKDEPYCPVKKY